LILIFSISRDQATNGVVPWLDYLGCPYIRLNDDEPPPGDFSYELTNTGFRFRWKGRWRDASEVSAVWYRKGSFFFPQPHRAPPAFEGQPALNEVLAGKLKSEPRAAARYFHELVRAASIRTLGNAILGDPNKLVVLDRARRCGLSIPSFTISDRINERQRRDPECYVTKAMSDGVYLWDADCALRGYFSYTEQLTEVIDGVADEESIPVSMIQEKIEKNFEVRSFFLDGRFASCAIYSQDDPQTALDHRKYNMEKPNRNLPMVLPGEVSSQLVELFRSLELNTGSVDMIVDTEGRFVFLEINPVGIYGGMQSACNYQIDRAVANWLGGVEDHDWC
jgi:ATP-GRASP peptide maturase of grasp-with-spasm system